MKHFFNCLLISCAIAFTSVCSYGQQTGIIKTARSAQRGIVSFYKISALSGVSNAKHIDGYVSYGDTSLFIFPVGHKGSYRPFAAEASGTLGAYFFENPNSAASIIGESFPVANKDQQINKVSDKEFWDIEGVKASRLTLTWNANSNISGLTENQLANLSIVGWNGNTAKWETIPSNVDELALLGEASTITKGSITTLQPIVPNTYKAYALASLVVPSKQPVYAGKLEVVNCTQIRGWIWDEAHPEVALIVELVENGVVKGQATADLFRQDLKTNGTGTGKYGFAIAVPSELIDGKSHQFDVRVRRSNFKLSSTPQSLSCMMEGALELASCTEIKGWIWDKNQPGTAVTVELVEGNSIIATTSANILRSDLKDSGVGSGAYGFIFRTPNILKNNQDRAINVRVKGTTFLLSDSPKVVTCVPPAYAGRFEGADCNTISGWVWDKNYPGSALVVELIEGSKVHATATANIYKESLKTSNIGTGNYAFKIALPAALKDGQSHQLSVRVKGTSFIVSESPRTVTCAVPSLVSGTLESADCNTITGWAWDKNYPDKELTVELVEGNSVKATATANAYRADLKNNGTGTGNYGFSIPLPVALKDGLPHQLGIRIQGTTVLLTGSPKSVTCALPNVYAGRFEGADCNTVSGWVWDKNYPGSALVVELMEGNTVHATATANIYKESLKTSNIGTGNYAFKIALPAALKDGQSHQLSVRVKGTSFIVPGSPLTVICVVPSLVSGTLESADCNTIVGWAWDKNYPSKALTVELVEGNSVKATATASAYRADLKNNGTGTGNYGFSIPLPVALKDGLPHQLGIRIQGTTVLLTGSPKSVTCALPNVYAGRFEGADCNTVSGWVWDKSYPGSALVVELMEGNTVHATATANIYKESLKTSNIGTGNYAFKIALPAALKDGQSHQLSVRVKGTSFIVPGSPLTVTCVVPSLVSGTLESADCNTIVGWAWDKNYPSKALTVELVEGNSVKATATASAYRADLKNNGTGTGNYGFSIPLPVALKDGLPHQLGIRIQGTTVLLTGSPKSVTCALPNVYAGRFEGADCNTVSGWVWDKSYPGSALVVELMEGNTVHATATANIYKESLKTSNIGTGNYAFKIALPAALKDGQSHQLSVRVKGTSFIVPGSPLTVTCVVPSLVSGTLESADCNTIVGWAWDKNYPSKALTVELVEGNSVKATATASAYRADLKNNGTGTGNYGFSIPLPVALKDGLPHQLGIRIQGTTVLLTGSPKSVTCALPNVYAGRFEGADCNTVSGWVWDKSYPGSALVVELMEGNTVHATATANIYKESLKTSNIGTGNYAFKIALPAALKDGQSHQLSVRVKGTSFIVPGSPLTVTCVVPSLVSGTLESADCNTIVGWAWDKNYPSKALTVELVEGNSVKATATASAYRADLKNNGTGTGNYGFSIPLPVALKDGLPHQLGIRIQGTTVLLTGSPKSVTCALPNVYAGRFEGADCKVVSGWVRDKSYPDRALTVELVEDTIVHASGIANLYKASLKDAGYGTGYYGFKIALPNSLKDGNEHQLNIKVKGTEFELPETLSITCPSVSAATARVSAEYDAGEDVVVNTPLSAAPNPTNGKVTVDFFIPKNAQGFMKITNFLGQSIWEKSFIGEGTNVRQDIEFGQNVSGVYILQLRIGEKTQVKRIVLIK